MTNSIKKVLAGVLMLSFVFTALPAETTEARSDRDRSKRCVDVSIELSDTRVYAERGEYFEYKIRFGGGDLEEFEIGKLPRGLDFDDRNYVIKGTPRETGTFRVEMVAENRCSTDSATLRIVVREEAVSSYPNVVLESTFVENDEKGYVYLTQIPYTGAGDMLRLSLIGFALALWGGALGFALLNPEKKERFKNMFTRTSTLGEAPVKLAHATVAVTESPVFDTPAEVVEEESSFDSEELQILRTSANSEKILFSEEALKTIVSKSRALGGPSHELLTTIMEGAKATYPREDGFIKIDSSRIAEMLS